MSTEDSSGSKLGYIVFNEAWYAETNKLTRERHVTDEITFGEFAIEGGCVWEAQMRWYDFGDHHGKAPKLEAFHDGSWVGIYETGLSEALCNLGDDSRISPEGFRALLETLGYVDMTERERDAR